MKAAAELISRWVVTGRAEERLGELGRRVADASAHYIAVFEADPGSFLGLIRLADVMRWTDPGNRLLADLLSGAAPLRIRASEPASSVTAIFEQHNLGEAVVFTEEGQFLGLITRESVLQWCLQEQRRTAEQLKVEEANLRATQQQLEAEARRSYRFFSAVSHELRTPLNPILLIASERAAMAALPDEVRADFRVIAEMAAHEAKLVEDLLAFTKLAVPPPSAGTSGPAPVYLHEVLNRAITNTAELMAAKDLQLIGEFNSRQAIVQIEPDKLERVFWHILVNAIKFTPAKGSIRIETRALAVTGELEIVFSDSGVGINPAELEHVFTPFAQGDPGPAREGRTFGILGGGLLIAKSILESHGGSIAVASPGTNQGSTFTLRLPEQKGAPAETTPAAADAPPPR